MGRRSLLSATLGAVLAGVSVLAGSLPIELELRRDLNSQLANVHIINKGHVGGTLNFTYGSCTASSEQDIHHTISKSQAISDESRLVWIIPEGTETDGCISAWSADGALVGRSKPQRLHKVKRKAPQKRADGIPMTDANGFDVLGPWFEGVEFLKDKQPGAVDVKAAKSKQIAIVGAGMSGLMTYLVLSQAGLKNISILEASERIGGRVHTTYLSGGPFDYSYQEMGPMRFPHSYIDRNSNKTYNISDFQLVFSLAEEMNKINKHDKNLRIDFIRWFETSENGLQYNDGFKLPSGLPPTLKQISQNASLGGAALQMDADTKALNEKLAKYMPGNEFNIKVAQNMHKAHSEWIKSGLGGLPGERWSEFSFLVQFLKGSLNATDFIAPYQSHSLWEIYYEDVYQLASEWKTIDGGLNRLPQSFRPLVDDITRMKTSVERVKYENNKVTLEWRDSFRDKKFQSSTHDYAIIAVPFTVVRQWRLPKIGHTMSNAIKKLAYASACKVALEYSDRFWEKFENPIFGGCSTKTDIPGIGSICYPSYNLNSSGPASILSYMQGPIAPEILRVNLMSDEEHVQHVLDIVTEIHGEETRKLYTGKWDRKCWAVDPLAIGSWAAPDVGQHEIYIPEFFKVHSNMIFVGEHTSYTHGWVPSALESGIRGGVQTLLELGLVDEAKAAVEKWMARWMEI